jgi:hypothetical protein
MRTCGACGREVRKTTFAMVLDPAEGSARVRRVCQACAGGGISVVAKARTTTRPFKPEAGKVAEVLDKAIRQLRVLAKGAEAASMEANDHASVTFHDGRRAAFEGAVEVLKRFANEG